MDIYGIRDPQACGNRRRLQRRVVAGVLCVGLLTVLLGLPARAVAQILTSNVSSLSFGVEPDANPRSQAIEIFEAGGEPSQLLQITGVSLSGPGAAAFNIETDNCYFSYLTPPAGQILGPGTFCTMAIEFLPESPGGFEQAYLDVSSSTVTDTNPAVLLQPAPLLQISVTGTGQPGNNQLTLSPASLNFGAQPVSVPITQYLTIINTTDTEVNVEGTAVEGPNQHSFTASASSCGTLVSGARCTLSVTFNPGQVSAPGSPLMAEVLVVAQTDVSPPAFPKSASTYAAVSGIGTAAVPIISPSSVPFYTQNVGTPATQMAFIYNAGSAPLRISAINLESTANLPSFGVTDGNCISSPVAAGSSCMFPVTFTPQATGLLTAYINIDSNASNPNAGGDITRIDLAGTGAAGTGQLTFNPASLTFGPQPLGTTSAIQSFVVTNGTSNPVNFTATSIMLGGAHPDSYVLLNYCKTPLAVGAECFLEVSFKPMLGPPPPAGATVQVNATILTGIPGIPGASLKGFEIGPTASLTVTPSALTFSSPQAVHTASAPQTLTVTNTTKITGVRVSAITLCGTYACPSFFLSSNQCLGPLAPGASCTLAVEFDPQSAASVSGALALGVTENNGTMSLPNSNIVSLSGTGMSDSVPSVTQKPLAQALAELTSQGYEVGEVSVVASQTYAPGMVINENPNGGGIQNVGTAVNLTVSSGSSTSPIAASINDRALAQSALAVGLAVNLLESQTAIASAVNFGTPGCISLVGSGSVWSGATVSQATVYYDSACSQPYIVAAATVDPMSGKITAETAQYYALGAPGLSFGTLTFTASYVNQTSIGIAQSYSGSFTAIGLAANLGFYCGAPIVASSGQSATVLPCTIGIEQEADGYDIGSLTTLDSDGLGFGGINSSVYIGPTHSLTLGDPNSPPPALITAPFMDITGAATSFESFSTYGAYGALTVFPPAPTGWTVLDSSGDDVQIIESVATTGTISYSLTMTGPNTTGASATLDAAGNGTITYSSGDFASISNWIIGN